MIISEITVIFIAVVWDVFHFFWGDSGVYSLFSWGRLTTLPPLIMYGPENNQNWVK